MITCHYREIGKILLLLLYYYHVAHVRVRLAPDTLPQTPHRAGALCTRYAPFLLYYYHMEYIWRIIGDWVGLCFGFGLG